MKGHRLQWENAQEFTWMYMIFLGASAVFCLEWKQKEDVRKAEKKRKDQLLYEYPQMVEQMSLLLGSGMTILALGAPDPDDRANSAKSWRGREAFSGRNE
ncbi:MAG: hypothetical protein V8R80_09640 [Eubacterium sp.]